MADQDIEKAPSLPELHASELTAAGITQAISVHGALIVRELVSREDVAALDSAFHRAGAAVSAAMSGGDPDPEWYAPYDDGTEELASTRKWIHAAHCLMMADSPGMLKCVGEVYRRAGIIDLLAVHLGEEPVLSSQKSTLRLTTGNIWASDNWHQDGAFLGMDIRVLNVWLALTHCGERAASVEIGTTRQTAILPPDEGSNYGWSVGPARAAEASPHSVVPICAPGDAVLFDHLCLHRTSCDPAYTEVRRALETWFFAPSTYPAEFDPRPITL